MKANTNHNQPKKNYSITEATICYKQQNINLIRATQIFINFKTNQRFTGEELEFLTSTDLTLHICPIISTERKLLADDDNRLFFNNIFNETIDNAKVLYTSFDNNTLTNESDRMRGRIIKHTDNPSLILKAFDSLHNAILLIIDEGYYWCGDSFENDEYIMINDFELYMENTVFYVTVQELLTQTDMHEAIRKLKNEILRKEILLVSASDDAIITSFNYYIQQCKQALKIYSDYAGEKTVTDNPAIDDLRALPIAIPESVQNKIAEIPTPEITTSDSKSVEDSAENDETDAEQNTCRQSTLALYFLLHALDSKSMASIDNTVKARFIQLITGKSYSKIYKLICSPFKPLDDESAHVVSRYKKDIECIINQFESLKLHSVINHIRQNTQP